MSRVKYLEVRKNPPTVNVKEDAREVVFNTVASMCDNLHKLTFKKNLQGDFKVNGNGSAYSNFQIPMDRDDLEWLADDGKWDEVVKTINEGVQIVYDMKSR